MVMSTIGTIRRICQCARMYSNYLYAFLLHLSVTLGTWSFLQGSSKITKIASWSCAVPSLPQNTSNHSYGFSWYAQCHSIVINNYPSTQREECLSLLRLSEQNCDYSSCWSQLSLYTRYYFETPFEKSDISGCGCDYCAHWLTSRGLKKWEQP